MHCLHQKGPSSPLEPYTVNLKGGMGRNIAIDQVMEHCVRDTKRLMYGQGANLFFKVAQTYSRASDDVKSIMNNFDQTTVTNVRRELACVAVAIQRLLCRLAESQQNTKEGKIQMSLPLSTF